jgi:phage shock protein A
MEENNDLSGMDAAAAKEYILQHIAALKLTRKKIGENEEQLAKWNARIELARSRGEAELAALAEGEAAAVRGRQTELSSEAVELQRQIEGMLKQLPAVMREECGPASDYPFLLEQQALMTAGYLPGDDEKAESDRRLRELEKDAAAVSALAELKARMKDQTGNGE